MQGLRELTFNTRKLLIHIQILHERKYGGHHLKSMDVIERVLRVGQYDSRDYQTLGNLRKQYMRQLIPNYKPKSEGLRGRVSI